LIKKEGEVEPPDIEISMINSIH